MPTDQKLDQALEQLSAAIFAYLNCPSGAVMQAERCDALKSAMGTANGLMARHDAGRVDRHADG